MAREKSGAHSAKNAGFERHENDGGPLSHDAIPLH